MTENAQPTPLTDNQPAQVQTPQDTTPALKNSFFQKHRKVILLFLIILITIPVIILFLLTKPKKQKVEEGATKPETNNWLTYANNKENFTLDHPPTWEVQSSCPYLSEINCAANIKSTTLVKESGKETDYSFLLVRVFDNETCSDPEAVDENFVWEYVSAYDSNFAGSEVQILDGFYTNKDGNLVYRTLTASPHNDNCYLIDSVVSEQDNQGEILNQILSSFEFTK